jgi:hypothetical protein
MALINPATQAQLANLNRAAEKLNHASLSGKIRWLKEHKSPDQLQQMQTDAIVDLYDAVKQIQEAIWPMLVTMPDVGAVRDAAQGAKSMATPVSNSAAALKQTYKPR